METKLHGEWVNSLRQGNRLYRNFRKRGHVVALLGVDGSGKSTIIRDLRSLLELSSSYRVRVEHLRPNLLPSLARLFGREESESQFFNPHRAQSSGVIGSILRVSYYTLDYLLGYWLKVFPAVARTPCIWIFDRYFYDYFIDAQRNLCSLPEWILTLYSLLVPRPDIIICLGAKPEIIHARKAELGIDEIRRQIEHLRKFSNKNSRAVWIDTGCTIQETVDRAFNSIISRIARPR